MTAPQFFLVDRLGLPYEGTHAGEPRFDRQSFNRPSRRTKMYRSVAAARRVAMAVEATHGIILRVRRVAPSGAVTGADGEAV